MAIIISIMFFIISLYYLYKANNIKQIKYSQNKKIQEQIDSDQEKKDILQKEVIKLQDHLITLKQEYNEKRQNIDNDFNEEKTNLLVKLEKYKKDTSYIGEQYFASLEKAYEEAEDKYDQKILNLQQEMDDTYEELQKLKNSLSAGMEAQLREKEREEKSEFYKLQITEQELSDITALNQIKTVLHQPVILSKLIWSTFFQKQTNTLCNKILGTNIICGIYKITNLKTNQCYIGQSVNIADRWKSHIKCGCGIDAPATNKLYNAMQQDGVWNYTFELVEKCPREELNQKERFWIDFYQSDKFGYNATKGNK